MNKKFLAVPSIALAGALIAAAQNPTKVGIIHIQRAIIETKEGQAAAKQLEAKTAPIRKDLEKKQADIQSMQNLYHQIVPPLLHPVEPQPRDGATGWMCNEGVKCYVGVSQGVYGIVLAPLIHPDASDVSSKLASLIASLPDRRNRPVYVCVRSYQAWLEPVLADLGAYGASRQAVMVKHLAHLVKDAQAVSAVPQGVSIQPSRVSKTDVKNS